jgi:mRNA interferase MazF
MKRGDVWTVAGGGDYAGKPRPVVILQDDGFDATDSITICAFTTDETDAPLFRLPVEPNARNGLRVQSLMVDKITTVPKSKVGAHIGRLDDEDIVRLNQAVFVFLGLAVSPREERIVTRHHCRDCSVAASACVFAGTRSRPRH